MSAPLDPDTSVIERMLHDRTRQTVPPSLRPRVLAAVADVLPRKPPATPRGMTAQRHPPAYADVVAGTFLVVMVTALSVPLVAMLAWAAASSRVGLPAGRPMLSFAQRAEAAGITLDVGGPSTPQLAGRDVRFDDGGRPRDILRSIDARSFLQGEL